MNQIEHLARELARVFYDQKRSDKFRSRDALTRAKTLKQFEDGSVNEVTVAVPFKTAYPDPETFSRGHWPLFIDAARKCLTNMLALPTTSPDDKQHIYEALLVDKFKRDRQGGGALLQQRKPEPWHADQLLRNFK